MEAQIDTPHMHTNVLRGCIEVAEEAYHFFLSRSHEKELCEQDRVNVLDSAGSLSCRTPLDTAIVSSGRILSDKEIETTLKLGFSFSTCTQCTQGLED